MITIIQTAFIFFASVMIYFALLHYKKRELTNIDMFVWFIIWILAILLVIFPDIIRKFSQTFLYTRLFDLAVVAGLAFIMVLVSKAYLRTRQLEKKLEQIIRKDALKNGRKK